MVQKQLNEHDLHNADPGLPPMPEITPNAESADEPLEGAHGALPAESAEAVAPPEGACAAETTEEMQAKLDEMRDKYLRVMAEFDNYKRRMARDYQRMAETAGEALLQELIGVRENFQRALRSSAGDGSHLEEGMKLIFAQFDEVLKRNGLEEFCEAGDAFDPQIHDALLRTPHEHIPEGNIAEVYEKGYRLRGRVIRHARVIVSAGAPPVEQPLAVADGENGNGECS